MPTDQPSPGHLWFLYYLMYFYLLIPICFVLSRCSVKLNLGWLITSPWFVFGLCIYTVATLWYFRGGVLFEGFIFIKPHPPSLLYYGSFFFIGFLFHYHRSVLETFRKYCPVFAMASLALFPLAMYFTHMDFANEAEGSFHPAAVISNAFLTWMLIYLVIGLFLRHLDFESPGILYISNSSYWVYLLQMPVVCAVAWLVLPLALLALVKFLIVALVTTCVCFLSYHYLVQNSWPGSTLNGKNFNAQWPWKTSTN